MPRAHTHAIVRAQDAYARQVDAADPKCCTGSIIISSPDSDIIRIVPTRCHRWTCPSCAPYLTQRLRHLITQGRPERHIVLTCRPNPRYSVQEHAHLARQWLSKLIKRIRQTWGPIEYVSVLEWHRNGAPHLHLATRGTYVAKRWLSAAWQHISGSSYTYIRHIDSYAASAAELAKYISKSCANPDAPLKARQVYTISHGYPLVPRSDTAETPEPRYYLLYTPHHPTELIATLRALGARVTRADAPFSPYEIDVSGTRPPPYVSDAHLRLDPDELDLYRLAHAILQGPSALSWMVDVQRLRDASDRAALLGLAA